MCIPKWPLTQDAVKLCFQAAFGAEHMLSDKDAAMSYLQEEYSQTPGRDIPIFEPISDEYARCNIAAWKYNGLPIEWLWEMFSQTAEAKREHSESLFMEFLDCVGACAEDGILPFDSPAWLAFRQRYLSSGIEPVHHSQEYRDKEHPAYRVVETKYASTRSPFLLCRRQIARPSCRTMP